MTISVVGCFQLLHEREATRLAVKEMDNLLHIIGDEVGSSTDFCLPTADMLTIKSMGRLRESVVCAIMNANVTTCEFSETI